jgi:predicted DNA-binding transcriptional regulator AlpA
MNQKIDLLNIGDTCKRAALPYSQTLKAMNRDPDFPKPAFSQGKAKRWQAKDIDLWASKYKEKSVL